MLHRHARPAVAGAFVVGSVTGALLSAAGLLLLSGLLSPIPLIVRATAAMAALVLLALHQARIVCLPLPQHEYQIPQTVFHGDPVRAAWRFSFELGTGVRTYVTTAAPYALALALLATPSTGAVAAAIGAALAGLGFGLGRSVVIAAHSWRRRTAVDHPRLWLTAAAWVSLAASATVIITALSGA